MWRGGGLSIKSVMKITLYFRLGEFSESLILQKFGTFSDNYSRLHIYVVIK